MTLRPQCIFCGYRKGGRDSFNGLSCRCGHVAPPMPHDSKGELIDPEIAKLWRPSDEVRS